MPSFKMIGIPQPNDSPIFVGELNFFENVGLIKQSVKSLIPIIFGIVSLLEDIKNYLFFTCDGSLLNSLGISLELIKLISN